MASTLIEIKVLTDHKSLQHWYTEDLNKMMGAVGRRGRWHEFLSQFNLEIVYVPGKDHHVSDALSRWAYPAGLEADISFHGPQSSADYAARCDTAEDCLDSFPIRVHDVPPPRLFEFVHRQHQLATPAGPLPKPQAQPKPPAKVAHRSSTMVSPPEPVVSIFQRPWSYSGDPTFETVWNRLKDGDAIHDYQLQGERLLFQHKSCVPKSLERQVVQELHNLHHAGFMKCFLILRRSYHFGLTDKDLSRLCEDIVRHCQICQCVRKKSNIRQGTLDYWPIPDEVFSCLCMDFVDLPSCQDAEGATFDYALVIVCRLSGYVVALPCRKTGLTAEHCARLFLRHCVAIFGLPHEIMSDNDHLISSRFMNTLCALSGVTQHTSIVYRPKGNGRAETGVRLVVDILRKSLTSLPRSWVDALPWAVWQLNDLPGIDGSNSPHKILFGRDPIGFGESPPLRMGRSNPSAESWFQNLQALRLHVQKTVQVLHDQRSVRYHRNHQTPTFKLGDRVWVRNLPNEATKLDPLWTGPCEVLARVGDSARYTVTLPDGICDVHIDRLKMYLPRVDGSKIQLHYYRPLEKVPEDDTLVVERILDHRVRSGKHQWLVKWKGYDASFNTWEPAASFVGYLQQDWLRFNREQHISINTADLV